MNFHYREPLEYLIYALMVFYLLRIAVVQVKIFRRAMSKYNFKKLLTYPYMIDTLLGVVLLTSLIFEIVQVYLSPCHRPQKHARPKRV